MRLAGTALLLCAATWLAPRAGGLPASSKERKAQFASWDEVNVIAHGLLQLGHGLKEHVDKTKGQLRELGSRLGAHNGSLGQLLLQAREEQEQGAQLSAAVRELQGADQQLFNLSAALRHRLRELAGDKAELQARLERLEGRVRQVLEGRPAENQSAKELDTLQSLVDAQSARIEALVQKLKQQQYKLDKQNLQIKSLQSKVNLLIPLHLKDNKTQSLKWRLSPKKSIRPTSQSQNTSVEPAQPETACGLVHFH